MTELSTFLATSPIFAGLSPDDLEIVAPLLSKATYEAGSLILKQGGYSDAVYILRSGRLAVRIQRGTRRDTVAMLQPPDAFGELSFITGRQCIADIEVVVDSEVVFLRRDSLPKEGPQRDALMRGLLGALATRLQVTMQRGTVVVELPVVLVRNHPNWKAQEAFAGELATSLSRQTGSKTLLVNVGEPQPVALRDVDALTGFSAFPYNPADDRNAVTVRHTIARLLTEHKEFPNVILNVVGPHGEQIARQLHELSNFHGHLLGAGDPIPETNPLIQHFIVQSADRPTLPILSCSRQLIREEEESEAAVLDGRPPTKRFLQTVDSIARRIAGTQVGLALGGGAAWGWTHIGVLAALREAGLPIDVIAGCSMGGVIGSLYCAGHDIQELHLIADYWRNRTKRLFEWRFWRMCLVNERALKKVFAGYFGDLQVNQTDIPFWANAVDIVQGREHTIRDGSLVDCLRGSIALPGLLPPYSLPPLLLVDAGIMDPVPAMQLREMGCNYAIGVNAMAAPGSTSITARYPFNAFDVMMKCMFTMGHEIGKRAEKAADLVFTPDLAGITLLQFHRSAEIIERGKTSTLERIPEILAGYERLKRTIENQKSQHTGAL